MNKEIIEKRFNFYLKEVKKHLKILKHDLKEIEIYYPLDENKVENLISSEENLKILDQIAYRFLKLQDTLGKLIRYFLLKKGELVEHLPILDIIHLAEKFSIKINDEIWFEMRSLRNSFTHDYPEFYSDIAEAINLLYKYIPIIEEIIRDIESQS